MPETEKHGFVVALDGPDGVGKSTQVKLLVEYLESKGHIVHSTRSSGGTPIGEELRKVSLSSHERPAGTDLHISLAMGYALAEDIQKRKANGEVIIIDRSPLAIVAYNGYGSELQDKDEAFAACETLFKAWQIDQLIFFTAAVDVLEERRTARGTMDYFESKGPQYHQRVQEGYEAGLDFLQQHPELGAKVTLIDASGTVDAIHQAVLAEVEKVLV